MFIKFRVFKFIKEIFSVIKEMKIYYLKIVWYGIFVFFIIIVKSLMFICVFFKRIDLSKGSFYFYIVYINLNLEIIVRERS